MRQKTVKPWARDRDKLNKWVPLTGRGQDTLSKARSFGLGYNTSTRMCSRRELLRAGSRPHYLVPPEMPVEGPSPTLVGSLGNSTRGKQGGNPSGRPSCHSPHPCPLGLANSLDKGKSHSCQFKDTRPQWSVKMENFKDWVQMGEGTEEARLFSHAGVSPEEPGVFSDGPASRERWPGHRTQHAQAPRLDTRASVLPGPPVQP